MSLFHRWHAALDDLRSRGRARSLALPCGLDLTSNDYLGYAAGRLPLAPDDAGLSHSGAASRLLRGHHPVWDEVESALADWHGAETALFLTCGYMANEGLLSTLLEPGDWVASDERNHASIIDGLRLGRAERFVYRHNDLNHLESGLHGATRHRRAGSALFIVTESLFSMDGDRTPLADIADIAERHGAHLLVDEAHATGCLGPAGAGCVTAAGLRGGVLATVHTGGKALGVPGAYICGSALLKEYLVNRCRQFIYTTALPPVAGAWWRAAIERVRGDNAGRRALAENAAGFRAVLLDRGISAPGSNYVVPIVVGEDSCAVAVAQFMRKRGYDVRAIRPPTVPDGAARLRISIHADHDPTTLTAVAAALAEAMHLQ
jgi:8-amino-7-oxononanoate synthase